MPESLRTPSSSPGLFAILRSGGRARGMKLRIANKPGSLEGVRNDSGIVFLKNRPYIICVMTSFLASERAGEDAITRISAAAYGVFDRFSRASELGRVISPSNGNRR